MDEIIRIPLSRSQRNLLLEYEIDFADPDLFRLVRVADRQGKRYEIALNEGQLEALIDQVADLSNQEWGPVRQNQLEILLDYLELFSTEPDEYDEYSQNSSNTGAVCILKVTLAYEDEIWRTIAIREGQTLHDLHRIIFEAFDREDEHLYSFFFPHTRIRNFEMRKIYRNSVEYTHPYALEDQGMFESTAQDASPITIGNLALRKGQEFYYLFDFGDSWWHQIAVEKTGEEADDGTYPRIMKRKGKSPEQYPDPDE